jgi:hypothetical protein
MCRCKCVTAAVDRVHLDEFMHVVAHDPAAPGSIWCATQCCVVHRVVLCTKVSFCATVQRRTVLRVSCALLCASCAARMLCHRRMLCCAVRCKAHHASRCRVVFQASVPTTSPCLHTAQHHNQHSGQPSNIHGNRHTAIRTASITLSAIAAHVHKNPPDSKPLQCHCTQLGPLGQVCVCADCDGPLH